MEQNIQSISKFSENPLIAYFPQLNYDPITRLYYIPENFKDRNSLYLNRITENGGEVRNLDFISSLECLTEVDGFMIPGGADIDPVNYNQRKNPKTVPHPLGNKRVEMERKILEILPKGVPILGICYGAQILNILRGF